MNKANVKVKHGILPGIELDKLRQLRSLTVGNKGLMIGPLRKTIAYKMGKAMPLSIVKKMHNSRVAIIEIDGQIVSWGLILSESKTILDRRCQDEGIQSKQVQYEIHLFTKKEFRGQGLATKIAKSIKRKYPRTKFLGYWDESSVFCKTNLVKLASKDMERNIKMKYSQSMS